RRAGHKSTDAARPSESAGCSAPCGSIREHHRVPDRPGVWRQRPRSAALQFLRVRAVFRKKSALALSLGVVAAGVIDGEATRGRARVSRSANTLGRQGGILQYRVIVICKEVIQMAKQELLEVPPPESPVLAARREYIHKYVNTLGIHSVNCLA